ncbi:hypothetical protein ACFLY2_02405 [Patescibacteria group bacterium]
MNNINTQTYISPTLQAKKDVVDANISSLNIADSNVTAEITRLSNLKNTLDIDLLDIESSISSNNTNLQKLVSFETRVKAIDYNDSTDNTLKNDIDDLPDISNISTTNTLQAPSRLTRSASLNTTSSFD